MNEMTHPSCRAHCVMLWPQLLPADITLSMAGLFAGFQGLLVIGPAEVVLQVPCATSDIMVLSCLV